MNWYQKSSRIYQLAQLRGEWWIIDGNVVFADNDIGDIGHEGYVIDHIKRKYAYDEFDRGEWVDWDEFKKQLSKEAYEEQNGDIDDAMWDKLYKSSSEYTNLCIAKLKEMGATDIELAIADGYGDAREYGLQELGWKRVKADNIQTQTLTHDDLKDIANGLWDAYQEECETETFNIEVSSTKTIYRDIPYRLISDGSPSQLSDYADVPYRF